MANLSPTKAKATYAEGLAKAKQNKLFEARALFSSVAEAFPNAPEAWYQMGLIDRQIGRPLTAAQCFERAAQTKPDQYEILKELEQTARLVGRSDYAVELNKKLRTLRPQDPAPFVNMGLAQQQMGEFDAAEKTFKRAQQKWPKSGGLYRVWFQGKKFKFPGDPALKAAQALWNSPDLHPVDKSQLGYALGKAHEDLGHYDQVFSYLDPANQIRNDQHPYPASSRKAYLEDVLQAADEASVRRIGTSTQAPIFVIGTPRSGTTLVERIIAAHPQVKAGGEVGQGYFLHAVTMRESGKTRPLASAEAQDLDRFGAYYMRSAQETAQTNDLRITDKSIQNYIIMGWLAAAFPNARFIVVRRDPRDVALSIYKNYFAPNTHTYAQKLENIAFMMKLFDQAISHWSSRIDVSEVNYDVLTNDPEQESKKLIAAAGLEWDDACSRFYENKQTVSTLSLAQVRQPIYKSSSGAWKRYERELQPFIDAYYG